MARSSESMAVRVAVLDLVAQVPAGRVTTYGSIAECLGASARQVGRVLATLSKEEAQRVPWQRVVAEPGRVSIPTPSGRQRQVARLRREGVRVDAKGKVQDFEAVFHVPQWKRPRAKGRDAAGDGTLTSPAPRSRSASPRRRAGA